MSEKSGQKASENTAMEGTVEQYEGKDPYRVSLITPFHPIIESFVMQNCIQLTAVIDVYILNLDTS